MALVEKCLPLSERFGGNVPYQREDGRTYVMINGKECWIRTCLDMRHSDVVTEQIAIAEKAGEAVNKQVLPSKRDLLLQLAGTQMSLSRMVATGEDKPEYKKAPVVITPTVRRIA